MTNPEQYPVGAIVTDCADANAAGRQTIEFQRLLGITPAIVGVDSFEGLEVGGTMLDLLDRARYGSLASPEQTGVILGNAAPRSEDLRTHHNNGTPFCHFMAGKLIVAMTFEARSLALMRDNDVTDKVHLMDIPTVTEAVVEAGILKPEQAHKITNTQFRSLEFLPLVARLLRDGVEVPSVEQSLDHLPSVDNLAWLVDNFGNIKTTIPASSVSFAEGEEVVLANGATAVRHTRLADVPRGEIALTSGSSGYGDRRFLELAISKGNAAAELEMAIGSTVLKSL